MGEINVGFAASYVTFLKHWKLAIFVFWSVFLLLGGAFGLRFIDETTTAMEPPSGSEAAIANAAMAREIPAFTNTADLLVFIESRDEDIHKNKNVEQFTFALERALNTSSLLASYQSYHTLLRDNLGLAAGRFLAEDTKSCLISINIAVMYTSKTASNFADNAQEIIKSLTPKNDSSVKEITLIGIPAFITPIVKSVENDMAEMDAIVMPLALGVLGYILRSIRLILIPILCIATAATTSFLIMYGVGSMLSVSSLAPPVMMSILVAMSIDYSLFLLSRYREELLRGKTTRRTIEIMIWSAGHTILVSGLTLSVCFVGMLFFPMDIVRTIGVACAIAILITLAVNITLTPVLLLTWPQFFEKCIGDWQCCGKILVEKYPEEISRVEPEILDEDDEDEMHSSCWYRFGDRLLRFPINMVIVIAVGASVIPIGKYAFNMSRSAAIDLDMPRTLEAAHALNRLSNAFGKSIVSPYRLLMKPPPHINITSEQGLSLSRDILRNLTRASSITLNDVAGLMLIGGMIEVHETDLKCNISMGSPLCAIFRYQLKMFSNPDQSACWVLITPPIDPVGPDGQVFLDTLRAAVVSESARTHFELALTGVGSDVLDSINAVYRCFPLMISVTCGVVLFLVGWTFKSLLIPLRAILTIGLTLLWVYGLSDLAYEHGALNFLHVSGLKGIGSLVWMPPIMAFSIIVGIGLDYDIFLLVRIQEYWRMGFNTRESILRGLWKTGHIITSAGVIMAIAFSGLLVSATPAINQLAFYMVFSVLFDTFIVRSMIVPCLMDLAGKWNWWPLKQPPPGTVITSRRGGNSYVTRSYHSKGTVLTHKGSRAYSHTRDPQPLGYIEEGVNGNGSGNARLTVASGGGSNGHGHAGYQEIGDD